MNNLKDNLKKIFSSKEINSRVMSLGQRLSEDFEGKNPIFIGVLNGSFMFMADLMKSISITCEVDFIKLHSYKGTKSTGEIKLLKETSIDLKHRNIVIVEDIIDTGMTVKHLINLLQNSNPKSISVATLLFKSGLTDLNFNIDYIGFEITKEFVVGYGLDYNQKFRNLNSIYLLQDENTN